MSELPLMGKRVLLAEDGLVSKTPGTEMEEARGMVRRPFRS